MATKVFVSPGVYTSEKDLSYITRQVGVTTLGLVGETTVGPAFQPIFISNYGEFQSFFGGTNATRIKDNGAPKYELPYIAKSYLSQSNQLYVTRVLGLSGYDAGEAWGITLEGAMDPTTVTTGLIKTFTGLSAATSMINFTATTATGVLEDISSTNTEINGLILDNKDKMMGILSFLGKSNNPASGTTIEANYYRDGAIYKGASMVIGIKTTGTTGLFTTGFTSGSTTAFSGTPYADVENKLVALLRSRGSVNSADQTKSFEVTGSTNVTFDGSVTDSINDAKGDFLLTGTSVKQGVFKNLVSLDKTKKNFLSRVLGKTVNDGETPLFVEEFYSNMFNQLNNEGKINGVKNTIIQYGRDFDGYKEQFQPAVTPYVLSELRGNKILKLFRLHTISDGDTANKLFKVSIRNINLNTREFDVIIRDFYDTDSQPVILESFSRCTMDVASSNFIGRRIGTNDGTYPSKSSLVLVELNEDTNTSDAFPAGFGGYLIRDYQTNSNTSVKNPNLALKLKYGEFDNKRKMYLGINDSIGLDADFFNYKGKPSTGNWVGKTEGFHMDMDANSGANSVDETFAVGTAEFRSEEGVFNTDYEKTYARKFTFAPCGGFDGWDVYRSRRSNLDNFVLNGSNGLLGVGSGAFKNIPLSNGDRGITSDYYAYLEAIWTLRNPESFNVNVIATPGIDTFDNGSLIERAIEMVEDERADCIYVVTTPDTDISGEVLTAEDVKDRLDESYDSSYTCTYWPWIQTNDTENNVYIYLPPTKDVVRNIALTDNIAFPWFASAGIQRGDVNGIKARKNLTHNDREILQLGRINPITTFASDGIKIWGNRTLQIKDSALSSINVRRMLLQARKLISAVSNRLLFEQNDNVVRNQFLGLVNPILDNMRKERGLIDFRVTVSNSPEDYDRKQLTGQIFIKPTNALEVINLEFVVTNQGASFDDL